MIHDITVRTGVQECMVNITSEIANVVKESGVDSGVALLYIPHTTCSITIQENADPGVQHDMIYVMRNMVPRQDPNYRHMEDNSASHVQASMMGFSSFVFIEKGKLVLGRWQAIYLADFDGPRNRHVMVKILKD